MPLSDGKQVIRWNLIVSIIALVSSFVTVSVYLTAENGYSLEKPAARVPYFARVSGVHLVTLPSPLNDLTVLAARPFGAADVAHKVMRFFTKNVKPVRSDGENAATEFRSESAIMKELLSSAPAIPGGAAKVLHLCSASSCIGPYLSQLHVKRANQVLGRSIGVYALVYGDATVGRTIERDLKKIGVLIPTYNNYSFRGESAMPLQGVIGEMNSTNTVDAACSVKENSCQYRIRDNGTLSQISVPLLPFHSVSFGELRLSTILFDVVHIDVSSDETPAAICLLGGLLASSLRPSHIHLVIYPSPFLERILISVNTLREKAHYNVFFTGGRCLASSTTSSVLSYESLRELLNFDSSQTLSRPNLRGYAMEPLCILFLSQIFDSLPKLLEHVLPTDKEHAMRTFVFEPQAGGRHVAANPESSGVWGASNYLVLVVPFVVVGLLIWGLSRGKCRLRTANTTSH
ncbi:hypothetical protein TraAM80_02455 [Trypanosoma rangeli]|uniref:Uncharacterized protein n=1 Tax=Trypanosoma rangeli TaxID=5698 RepID=A0A422NTX3_TRYRA|nr:uncharacterized protein TraAM80_02455 [Trypanosoma rangeli]RNF08910.1 hypothetical protein TraAM80_02455 [Trypanosoma rangeli]|eukprot:RNF08910.1 hypothetical protein TraAM80_02455 [Trypanosoma rangeli]